MNKSEIAEKARKRFAFEQYAKTVTWNTYEGDDDPFAFFPESGVYANGDIQLAWLGWQWRERAIAESQASQPPKIVHLDCLKCGYYFEGWIDPPEFCPNDGTNLKRTVRRVGDGSPSNVDDPETWRGIDDIAEGGESAESEQNKAGKQLETTVRYEAPPLSNEPSAKHFEQEVSQPSPFSELQIAIDTATKPLHAEIERLRSGAAQEPWKSLRVIDGQKYVLLSEVGEATIKRIAATMKAEGDTRELKAALKLAKTRLEICRGRFRACHEDSAGGGTHPVSILEITAWIEEIDSLLG